MRSTSGFSTVAFMSSLLRFPAARITFRISAGDILAIEHNGRYVYAAVLTRQILFGGHWSFFYHGTFPGLLPIDRFLGLQIRGFNAVVDYIQPNRENRLIRLAKKAETGRYTDPPLVKSHFAPPIARRDVWKILKWTNKEQTDAEEIKTTYDPTAEELSLPNHGCLSADFAWKLAEQEWTPDQGMWKNV